jgi:hypothetical protein
MIVELAGPAGAIEQVAPASPCAVVGLGAYEPMRSEATSAGYP